MQKSFTYEAWWVFAATLLLPSMAFAEAPAQVVCPAQDGLSFLCGAIKPEDMKRIPGTHYIVTSGFSAGSGLKLVDTRTHSYTFWYKGEADQIANDEKGTSDCASPPDPALFNARGLSLRKTGHRTARLHVVNHGGREAIEVFDIIARRGNAAPKLIWRRCLLMPAGHVGNAVATYRDGTVLVSVLTRPGSTITDFELGRKTGGIFERARGDSTFRMIPGSDLPGNNGLETARDDSGFYAVAFGLRAIAWFRRGADTGPDQIIPTPGFMPDNVHWDGHRLLAAGMNSDEPACGGTRQIVNGIADTMLCPRGWKVAELQPKSGRFRLVAEGKRSSAFNGVSQAVLMGKTLWLGSYQADRIAFTRLRRP
jgi:hypothetical protein